MGCQVRVQPLVLRRPDRAADAGADPRALRVDHSDVPGRGSDGHVEAVVAIAVASAAGLLWRRGVAEVGEVAAGAARTVLVVADDRLGDVLEPTPAVLVAHIEVGQGAAVVLQVAQGPRLLR